MPKAVLKNIIPALFVLKAALGADGLAWAQPVADLLSTALAVFLYIKTVKKMEARARTNTEREIYRK